MSHGQKRLRTRRWADSPLTFVLQELGLRGNLFEVPHSFVAPMNLKSRSFPASSTRRAFLRSATAATALAAVSPSAFASILTSRANDRSLSFYNVHTSGTLKTCYWSGGNYVPESLAEINHLLRDYRTGELKKASLALLDALHELGHRLESREPFQVISGYRSPATNALLRANAEGVAKHSMHVEGKAADIRLPGCDLSHLHRAAMDLHRGGVGYYPASDFVHVDVGRIRYW